MQRAKHNSRKTLHSSMNGLRDHAAGMTGSVRDLGEAVKDVLFEKFTDMLKRAVKLGNKSTVAVQHAAADAKDDLEERIQDNPYKAILLAAGIGLLLGFVIHRK
jgi:ElaB/YqjD/DUF883 family membrane-anchored ribosome-binding protein